MGLFSGLFGKKQADKPKERRSKIPIDIETLTELENSGFKEMLLSLESKLVANKILNENYSINYKKGENRDQQGIFLSLTPRDSYIATECYGDGLTPYEFPRIGKGVFLFVRLDMAPIVFDYFSKLLGKKAVLAYKEQYLLREDKISKEVKVIKNMMEQIRYNGGGDLVTKAGANFPLNTSNENLVREVEKYSMEKFKVLKESLEVVETLVVNFKKTFPKYR